MTDPRIEATARELKRLFSDDESTTDDTWIACAKCVLEAVDAAARIDPWIEVVPLWDLSPKPPTQI